MDETKLDVRSGSAVRSWNPCVTCGACCAFYSATFYWTEADDVVGGTVPVEMTEKFGQHQRVMRGSNDSTPRCIALDGTVGTCVRCSIYPLRASVCREFEFSWQFGKPNERCDRARAAWGLPPLSAPTEFEPFEPDGDLPRAA